MLQNNSSTTQQGKTRAKTKKNQLIEWGMIKILQIDFE